MVFVLQEYKSSDEVKNIFEEHKFTSDILNDNKKLNEYIRLKIYPNDKSYDKEQKLEIKKKREFLKKMIIERYSDNKKEEKEEEEPFYEEPMNEEQQNEIIETININFIKDEKEIKPQNEEIKPQNEEIKPQNEIEYSKIEYEEIKPLIINSDDITNENKNLKKDFGNELKNIKTLIITQFNSYNVEQKKNYLENIIYICCNVKEDLSKKLPLELNVMLNKHIDSYITELELSSNFNEKLIKLASIVGYNIFNNGVINKSQYKLNNNFINDMNNVTPLIVSGIKKINTIKPSTLIKHNILILAPLITASLIFSNLEKKKMI